MAEHPETAPETAIAFEAHNHRRCVERVLPLVEDQCAARGLRLTPARRRVLEILLESHAALGAYAVLDRLSREGLGSQPPVVYRALGFLLEHGFAHKIQRMNAFVACLHPEAGHDPAFLICRVCKAVAETEAEPRASALGRAADASGFTIEGSVVEAEGVCRLCGAEPAA